MRSYCYKQYELKSRINLITRSVSIAAERISEKKNETLASRSFIQYP